MWLPDQEGRAVQAVRLLLSLGADPMLRNRNGDSAADIARRRGLEEVADLLDAAGVAPLAPDGWFGPFEKLAHEFRTAYLTGDTDAMASVAEFAGQSLPLAEFRTAVHTHGRRARSFARPFA